MTINAEEETRNGLTFKEWRRAVNRIIAEKVGFDPGVDWPSWDTWDSEASAEEGFEVWLEWNDEEGFLDGFI